MYHIEDILIPVRFLLLMLQIIITATFPIKGTYKDHIRANFPNYYIKGHLVSNIRYSTTSKKEILSYYKLYLTVIK